MNTNEIKVGQLGIDYIVDGSDTGSLGMFELTVPPGSNVRREFYVRDPDGYILGFIQPVPPKFNSNVDA